jgi:acetyl esterase/lipase
VSPPDVVLHYGGHADHLVDVRLPEVDGPRPVVVVVHGGFWKAETDREHAGPQSSALAEAGYVVATVEYRRVGQDGGGWPGTLDDIASVIDALPDLLRDAVGSRADLARSVLVGHSAGGHLAVWAASRHALPRSSPWWLPERLPVRGVVSLAGVLDLSLADRLHLGGDAVRGLLGAGPDDVPDRAREADPMALLPTGVGVHLVHGVDDDPVPLAVSQSFAARARDTGDRVAIDELPGTGHMELIDPGSPAWPVVLAAIARLVGPGGG